MTARTAKQLREMNVLLQFHHEYRYGCCEPSAISQGKKHSKECREREAAIAKAADLAVTDPRSKRKDVKVNVAGNFPPDGDAIDDWIAALADIKESVPGEFRDGIECSLSASNSYGDYCTDFEAYYYRKETDAEFRARFMKERRDHLRQAEADERGERAQLARLKAKYEGGT